MFSNYSFVNDINIFIVLYLPVSFTIMDNDNFPIMENKYDYSSFFRDELVFFYFHSVRFQKYNDFNSFSNRYETLLSVIKKQLHNDRDATLPYLASVYKLIANTRDIRHGKGQHDIAYMMILKL